MIVNAHADKRAPETPPRLHRHELDAPFNAQFIEALRAESRAQRSSDGKTDFSASIRHNLQILTSELQAANSSSLELLIDHCLVSNNPRGATAALVDALIPRFRSNTRAEIAEGSGYMPLYSKSPLEALITARALRLKSGDVVYDIGGADGQIATLLALLYKDVRIVSVEIQDQLSAAARQNQERFKLSNLEVVGCDAFQVDLSPATVIMIDFTFDRPTFERFVRKLNPPTLPTLVTNNMDEEVLIRAFPSLVRAPIDTRFPDLFTWHPAISSK
jgi:precorrin-6B methylase 2